MKKGKNMITAWKPNKTDNYIFWLIGGKYHEQK